MLNTQTPVGKNAGVPSTWDSRRRSRDVLPRLSPDVPEEKTHNAEGCPAPAAGRGRLEERALLKRSTDKPRDKGRGAMTDAR